MTDAIKVHGETYASVDELRSTIAELEEQLEQLPSEAPQHEQLARHIERLRMAADSPVSESGDVPSTTELPADTGDDAVTDTDDEVEATHSIRTAFETGATVQCPTCGQVVDLPESPPFDPLAERCDGCDGWGTVVTGSRVDGHIWRDCKKCQGQGYVDKRDEYVASATRTAEPVAQAPGARWNPVSGAWDPPENQQPPWEGAAWDSFYGKWA